jgi:hypothetical protein
VVLYFVPGRLNNGRLTAVGGRIVTEVSYRATEGTRTSLLHNPLLAAKSPT